MRGLLPPRIAVAVLLDSSRGLRWCEAEQALAITSIGQKSTPRRDDAEMQGSSVVPSRYRFVAETLAFARPDSAFDTIPSVVDSH
jgi:hypothetical protein